LNRGEGDVRGHAGAEHDVSVDYGWVNVLYVL